jgi:streptogramin lyase
MPPDALCFNGYHEGEFMIRAAAFLTMLALPASGAMAAEVLIHDAKSQPESLTVAADGSVFAGSASTPFIYRVKKGASTADVFVDASSEGAGTFFFGQLAEGNTLWTCQLTATPGTMPVQRRTSLRGFDIATGKEKLRWTLPGDNSTCNDFVVGPDKALYITDTSNSKIFRLAPGAQAAELWMENRVFNGIDGITFLDGVLYVNNVAFSKLYRVPVDASGKPGAPVDIWFDAPMRGLDGMRAANGKIFVANGGSGTIAALTIKDDTAHVAIVKDGLVTPTGVEPAGDTLWFTERGTGKIMSVPMPR